MKFITNVKEYNNNSEIIYRSDFIVNDDKTHYVTVESLKLVVWI